MLKKIFAFEINRFIMAGVLNNAFIYVIYLLGLLFLPYLLSYTISLGIGILISYYMNSSFVFKSSISFLKASLFFISYAFQYCLAIFLLYLLVDVFHFYKSLAPFVVVGLILPITFLLNKYIIQAIGPLPASRR